MKAACLILAGCVLLSGCNTPNPQGPKPIMSPTGPSAQKLAGTHSRQTDEVNLTERYIRVSGDVGAPGLYPLGKNTRTLVRALVTAKVTTLRVPAKAELHRVDGSVEVYQLREIEKGKAVDPVLNPNDHVHIPQRSPFFW